jgi:flavorubredoxin
MTTCTGCSVILEKNTYPRRDSNEGKNKKAAGFGSFGWSGESVLKINRRLDEAGFDVINEGLKISWNPDEEQITQCVNFGKEIITAGRQDERD